VEVHNVSVRGAKTHVGKGSIQLTAAMSKPNEPTKIIISLTHEGKKVTTMQGRVIMRGVLVRKDPEPSKDRPTNPNPQQKPQPQEPSKPQPAPTVIQTPPVSQKNAEQQPVKPAVNNSSSASQPTNPVPQQPTAPANPQPSLPSESKKENISPRAALAKRTVNENVSNGINFKNKDSVLKIRIHSLEAHDLHDTGGSMDKQDPALELKLGKRLLQTQR
jgi:hypothetical protein